MPKPLRRIKAPREITSWHTLGDSEDDIDEDPSSSSSFELAPTLQDRQFMTTTASTKAEVRPSPTDFAKSQLQNWTPPITISEEGDALKDLKVKFYPLRHCNITAYKNRLKCTISSHIIRMGTERKS